ncbi:hypothetical protein [Euzebya sp.]|uniref:hypothetical protein n=1 Tax=Euzebya sp. TaxID=1971409 RepID=UPI0035148534
MVVIDHGRLVVRGAISELQGAATRVVSAQHRELAQALDAAGATVQAMAPEPGRGGDGVLVVRGMPITEIGDRAATAGIALHELTAGRVPRGAVPRVDRGRTAHPEP